MRVAREQWGMVGTIPTRTTKDEVAGRLGLRKRTETSSSRTTDSSSRFSGFSGSRIA